MFLPLIEPFQLCQVYIGGGKSVELDICKNLGSQDIYRKETVTFIQVNFIEERCETFTEEVYISENRLLRIKSSKMYMFGETYSKPSCVPGGATYLVNGLFFISLPRKTSYISNISNSAGSKLALSICKEYEHFINAKIIRAVPETRDFIRQIYGSDNVTGYIVNGKIYVQPCTKTEITSIVFSKQINGICYKETPIVVNGSTLMFSSIGIDLESEATTTDCDEIGNGKFTIWEDSISLKRIILGLSIIVTFMIILNCIIIAWCTNKGKEQRTNEIDYNDFLIKLANDTIDEIGGGGRQSSYSLTAGCTNYNAGNEVSMKRDPITFQVPTPQPHPFESFSTYHDKTLQPSIHV
uniref:Glycoprotein n=1 Tax=Parastrongyloides trichosuri TaxID=131310 RepID=A0A0N4ZV42_PARTI